MDCVLRYTSRKKKGAGLLIDMLIEGNHRLTKEQHHANVKASRKRIREGEEGEARRMSMAKTMGEHYKLKPYIEAL